MKKYDVVALGELLIDFTENGKSNQGNPLFEANPGGAPCTYGFLINANRIRASRVLRLSRTVRPMAEQVNIPVLP